MACVYFMRKKVSCPQIRHSCQPLIITFTVQSDKKNRKVGEMVFCYQNCSDLLWEKIVLVIEKKLLKFEAEGQEFEKKILYH